MDIPSPHHNHCSGVHHCDKYSVCPAIESPRLNRFVKTRLQRSWTCGPCAWAICTIRTRRVSVSSPPSARCNSRRNTLPAPLRVVFLNMVICRGAHSAGARPRPPAERAAGSELSGSSLAPLRPQRREQESVFIGLMTLDRKLKASREGSK